MGLKYMIILYILVKMDLNENQKMIGVHDGVLYGQNERVDELNKRFVDRQFPDSALKPNIDMRPVQTKYTKFSVLDNQPKSTVNAPIFSDYRMDTTFNPGTDRAPVNGYFSNVDKETELRNQKYALQKGASQNAFIPSSESDLYKTSVVFSPSEQPHPLLFAKPSIEQTHQPHLMNIGKDALFNHTRTQLRDL